MNILMDSTQLFSMTDTQKAVIQGTMTNAAFQAFIASQIQQSFQQQYQWAFAALQSTWNPILIANGTTSVPADPDTYAQLVFALPAYQATLPPAQ
jgi:hypothetical protein